MLPQTHQRQRSTRDLYRLELNDNDWKELYTLHNEAQKIDLDSSLPTTAWKLIKFFLDEGSLFVLAILIAYFVWGDESLYRRCLPLVINVVTSFIIGFYLANEKRDVCMLKQNSDFLQVLKDTARISVSLMTNWCTENGREKKRKRRLEKIAIADSLFKDASSNARYVTEEGMKELCKFFSSQLRYMKEDVLSATIKGSSLAMCYVYLLVDHENMALPLCKAIDVGRIVLILWAVFKVSSTTKSFDTMKTRYVAAVQLWGHLRTKTFQPAIPLGRPNFNRLVKSEGTWKYLCSSWVVYILPIFSRFMAAVFIIIIASYWGFAIWITVLFGLNCFLLGYDYTERRIRSTFANPPTGFSTVRNKLIDRLISTLFYNYGYSMQSEIVRKSILRLAPVCVFYITVAIFKIDVFRMLFPFSNTMKVDGLVRIGSVTLTEENFHCPYETGHGNWSDNLGIIKCYIGGWNAIFIEPFNVIDYIGGLRSSIIYLVLLPIIAFVVELVLRNDENILEFEVFPYLDAVDCYRTLLRDVVNDREEHKKLSQIRNILAVTLISLDDFENLWQSIQQNGIEVLGLLGSQLLEPDNAYETDSELFQRVEIQVAKIQSERHPLYKEIQEMFNCIKKQEDSNNTTLRSLCIRLLHPFCKCMDSQLCQFTSYRMERTFSLACVAIQKTYE